ncbi:hypothetical protein [Neobacillus cucumis]|uniref:hypothetical protein n=1 Tax=Neobacillus cucumis TaxID=1740721 RepID=UPI002E2453F2|nr:hypothetical protein [Neobacillus cucumis]
MYKKLLNVLVILVVLSLTLLPISSKADAGYEVVVDSKTSTSITFSIDVSSTSANSFYVNQNGSIIYSSSLDSPIFNYTVNNLQPGTTYNFTFGFGQDGSYPYQIDAMGSTLGNTVEQDSIVYDETLAPTDVFVPTYSIVNDQQVTTQTGICSDTQLTTTQLDTLALDPNAFTCSGYSTSSINTFYSSTPMIDSLISITSYKRLSSGDISVTYKINKKFSTNEYIQIGYEWPSEYRNSLPTYYASASRSAGTYTITIPKPSAYVGRLSMKIKYGAGGGRYTESKRFGSVFHAPGGSSVKYHTVTRAEVYGDFFVYYAVPGVYFNFSPAGKFVKVLGTTYLGWSLWDNFSTRTSLSQSFPHPVEGQYYRITNYYSGYRLYTKTEVWSSRDAYSKGVTPSTYTTYYTF